MDHLGGGEEARRISVPVPGRGQDSTTGEGVTTPMAMSILPFHAMVTPVACSAALPTMGSRMTEMNLSLRPHARAAGSTPGGGGVGNRRLNHRKPTHVGRNSTHTVAHFFVFCHGVCSWILLDN